MNFTIQRYHPCHYRRHHSCLVIFHLCSITSILFSPLKQHHLSLSNTITFVTIAIGNTIIVHFYTTFDINKNFKAFLFLLLLLSFSFLLYCSSQDFSLSNFSSSYSLFSLPWVKYYKFYLINNFHFHESIFPLFSVSFSFLFIFTFVCFYFFTGKLWRIPTRLQGFMFLLFFISFSCYLFYSSNTLFCSCVTFHSPQIFSFPLIYLSSFNSLFSSFLYFSTPFLYSDQSHRPFTLFNSFLYQ